MSLISLGEMASAFMLRRRNTVLKQQLNQLNQELTTGVSADINAHLGGNLTRLSEIERAQALNTGFQAAITEGQSFGATMQLALEHMQDMTGSLSTELLFATNTADTALLNNLSYQAELSFGTIVSSLNTQVGGRSIFAGAAADRPAVANAGDMLAMLRTALAGATTFTDIQATLDTWFDTPGGDFETSGYLGSTSNPITVQLREGESTDISTRADDPALRNMLKVTAMAALAADPALGFSGDLQSQLLTHAGTVLLENQQDLTALRAGLGIVEASLENALVRNEAETTALDLAYSELLGVDQYEVATRIEDAQFQLESLYAVTVRSSQLSLLEFMT